MAYTNSVIKVLGQSAPAAANYTTALYTVPSGGGSVVSTLLVCNRSASADTFRVRVAIGNAASTNAQWAYYDAPIKGGATIALHIGLTLGSTDVVYAGSAGGNLSFQAHGNELT